MAAFEHKDYSADATGPLTGLRVLDLSRLVAGNTLTQLLADFGADVVKIESPAGDTLREWRTNKIETYWKLYCRNKKSLCLQLQRPEAAPLILRLVESATIFIESFRPGTVEAMGLGPDVLLKRNPKLVIVRISGWGQDGPYRRRPGFGTLIEGMSGFASMNGFGDREPVLPPTYLADTVAGLYGASGVLLALREVERNGGRGQVIDVPLFDPLFSVLGPEAAHYQLTGKVRARNGSRWPGVAPRNVYRARDDRWICISVPTQGMMERMFRAMGRPELVSDPRFKTNANRLANVDELDAIIAAFVVKRTQVENVAFFEAAEITAGPIYDISQITKDPHVLAREIIASYPDPEMNEFPMHHTLPRLLGTPGSIRARAPRLGEHSRGVLADIGVTDDQFAELVAAGIVVEDRGGMEES